MTLSSLPAQDDATVRVAVRARPLLEKEILDNCQECVFYCADRREISLGKEKRFTFDHVFCPNSGQEEVYLACVKPLVESCIAGYNATVLAYGQTGSGKTHTMGSANSNGLHDHELGILPRVIRQLYKSIEEQKQAEFLVKCSFVEIYNEEIKDLLHPETPSKPIFIREDANGDIILAGVREEVVTNFDDMMKFLEHGSTFRTTGSTLMNQHSSRSHAIFTIIVQQRTITDCTSDIDIITAKFHLVDLAGSERAKRTGAVGVRFKESITINSGLLALGNVISALGDERKRGQHVPYRQSKLTRILQDSLGGNSRTCMIACISTADINHEETLNTLKYANRARNIHNKPIINRDSRALQMNQLRQELKMLQEELISMRLRDAENATDCYRFKGDQPSHELTKTQNIDQYTCSLQQEILNLNRDLQDSQTTLKKLKEKVIELGIYKEQHQSKIDEIATEMNLLLQMIPSWESSKEISESPMLFLLQMAQRILADGKDEVADRNKDHRACSSQRDIAIDVLNDIQQRLTLSNAHSSHREQQPSVINKNDCLIDLNKENHVAAPGPSCTDTSSIMKHYLKTIQALQKKLIRREQELKAKDETLLELTSELARDQNIFSEKMEEIKTLRRITRELTKEKECLLQKVQMDATIISNLSQNALAKEGEISKLKASIESLQFQPQELFSASKLQPLSVMDKIGQQNDCFDPWLMQEDPFSSNKKEDTMDCIKPEIASNEMDSIDDEEEPNRRHQNNFEKRFQDLASLVLRGESPGMLMNNTVPSRSKMYTTVTSGYECEEDDLPTMSKNNDDLSICTDVGWNENNSEEASIAMTSTKNKPQSRSGDNNVISDVEFGDILCSQKAAYTDHKFLEILSKDGIYQDPKTICFEKKLREIALAWHAEKQAMEDMVEEERKAWKDRAMSVVKKHVQLERDHLALREELENTKSLMQKAGLGIRLSMENVRELSNGDVDLRSSILS